MMMFDKEVYFSEKQVLDRVDELKNNGFEKVKWYKVKNRFYVEWKRK